METAPSDATCAELLRSRMGSCDFTPRQQEVIVLVFQGLSNREIAEQLSIETQTVKAHLRSIFLRLNVCRRTALVAKILGLGADVACPVHMEESGEPALSFSCPSKRRGAMRTSLGVIQGMPSRPPADAGQLHDCPDVVPQRSVAGPCAGGIDPEVPINGPKNRWLIVEGSNRAGLHRPSLFGRHLVNLPHSTSSSPGSGQLRLAPARLRRGAPRPARGGGGEGGPPG
jgi:DNA-binding CsgD family transcriptional regulator